MFDTGMPIYQDYAAIYEAIGQPEFSRHVAAMALRWIAGQNIPLQRSLDLACGSGVVLADLAALGYEAYGLDRSTAMLNLARARLERLGLTAHLVYGDMRRAAQLLAPYAPFDLVTCLFDSLNYLVGDDDLLTVCAAVSQLLHPGGVFVFDMNTPAGLQTWDDRDEVVYDGSDYLVYNRLSYDPLRRLATGRVVWFARQGARWWRGEETHYERAWSAQEIQAAVEAAGMRIIAELNAAGEAVSADAPRIVYLVRKPEA